MKHFLRTGLALASLCAAAATRAEPAALAGEDRQGFHFCSAPYPPLCAHGPGQPTPEEAALCEEAVRGFTAAVMAYRSCLGREIERAIFEANQTIEALKCREDSPDCPHRPARIVKPRLKPQPKPEAKPKTEGHAKPETKPNLKMAPAQGQPAAPGATPAAAAPKP